MVTLSDNAADCPCRLGSVYVLLMPPASLKHRAVTGDISDQASSQRVRQFRFAWFAKLQSLTP